MFTELTNFPRFPALDFRLKHASTILCLTKIIKLLQAFFSRCSVSLCYLCAMYVKCANFLPNARSCIQAKIDVQEWTQWAQFKMKIMDHYLHVLRSQIPFSLIYFLIAHPLRCIYFDQLTDVETPFYHYHFYIYRAMLFA